MSTLSNDYGRAFEYITIQVLAKYIAIKRPVKILTNSSLSAAERAWDSIEVSIKNNLVCAAEAMADTILDLEPLIREDGDDELELYIQPDFKGVEGDVRDILIVRRSIHWEIGLSLKHNHFAAKHSRLGKKLDFGKSWYNVPCSQQYWDDIDPVFKSLEQAKAKGMMWREMPDKGEAVYVPLLNAFVNEVKRSANQNSAVARRMVEYLLGKYDFYKVISVDAQKYTEVMAFNIRGTLNNDSRTIKATTKIPVSSLPKRIVSLDFKPNSNNTVELYMDGGWQFSFRIHSASTLVQPSLKFDIQIIGMPTTIITINCKWR